MLDLQVKKICHEETQFGKKKDICKYLKGTIEECTGYYESTNEKNPPQPEGKEQKNTGAENMLCSLKPSLKLRFPATRRKS